MAQNWHILKLLFVVAAIVKDQPLYEAIPEWSDQNKFGQVAGVAVDQKGLVVVFHRPGRPWDAK